MGNKLIHILSNKRAYAIILGVITVVVSLQEYLIRRFNNFIIFRQSFAHLVHLQNLYIPYPHEYSDVFLYSPAFALLIAPFYYLPTWAGLLLWTGINSYAIYFAITMLPQISSTKRILIFFILVIELVTSLQNTQTNPILAACISLAFVFFEKEKVFWAAFFIVFGSFIKVYCLATCILFFLYPQKIKFILSMALWTIVFTVLPLIIVSPGHLIVQYQNWFHQMAGVHQGEDTGVYSNVPYPLSVMGWLKTWFHLSPPGIYIQLGGAILLLLPLLRTGLYKNVRFRYFLLSSILIFCVIFNHLAESPSYVIAVLGVALWFAWEKKNIVTWTLIGFAYVFTVLIATDIFPEYIRHNFGIPYVWKAVPCILIWFWIQYRVLFTRDFGIEIEMTQILP